MKVGLASALLLAACAEEETVLRLAAADPAECRAHCISAVTVSLDGVPSEHPCGEPIERGPLVAGRTHQVVVTATGAYGLNVVMEIRPERVVGEVAFKLEPSVRPQIDQLTISSERQAIYGTTRLLIEASNFTPGHPTTQVRVGDLDLPILSQAEGRLEVDTDRNGAFVLEQCGVASEVHNFAVKAVAQEVLTIDVPNCESPRYLSSSPYNDDPTRTLVAYGCGAQCNRTQLVRLSTVSVGLEVLAQVDGCPIDVAASREDLIWVSTETGLHVCSGGPQLSCTLRSNNGRYLRLSRADEDTVAGIFLADGATETSLSFETDPGGSTGVAPNRIESVAAIDGRMALANITQLGPRLLQWDVGEVMFPFRMQTAVPDCTVPRLVRRYRNQNNVVTALVVCGEEGNLIVYRITSMGSRETAQLVLQRRFTFVGPVP